MTMNDVFTNADQPDQGTIFDLLLGPIRMALLDAAVEMEIADILAQTNDLDRIAELLKVKADHANLKYFLDALVAMQFVCKTKGVYVNAPFADAFLRKSSPVYMGNLVRNLSRMQHRNLPRIRELVRHGSKKDVEEEDDLHAHERWKQSVRHLANYQKAGIADQVADLVVELPEFPKMRRMLDVGCGPGIMCMAIVSRHPSMQGVLCDLPAVIEVAHEEIESAGMQSRITAIRGDFNEVALGTGYDLVWASHTLYYAKDLPAMLRRVHQALNSGGVFMSFHEGLTHERTQPANVVLSRFSLCLEGQDVSFEKGEMAAICTSAGFVRVESRIVQFPIGPVELVVARKADRQ
jgi:2-polyprenyl-3-methyl-5-hydroxy-6-metoxy-1,4-benzoquinol methylase